MKQLTIELTQYCPNNCLVCSSMASSESILCLDKEKVYEVIASASNLGFDVVCLSGGEPFEYVGLFDILGYIKNKGLKVYIYTSGIITKGHELVGLDIKLLKGLKIAGCDKLIFDLPAITESLYDIMMGTVGCQYYVIESIRNAKALGITTELHFIVTKLNMSEIDNVIEFVIQEGLDRVSFLRLVLQGRALLHISELALSTDEIDKIKSKLDRLSKQYTDIIRVGTPLRINQCISCEAVHNKLCVRYDGAVFGCETFKNMDSLVDDEGKEVKADNILDKSLEDIMKNSKYLKLSTKLLRKRKCHSCPMQDCD